LSLANERVDQPIPATFAAKRERVSSSAPVSEKAVVRIAAVAVTAASLLLPTVMAVPAELPSIAMGSALLLYLERVLVVFVVLLFLLVFLYRALVRGELPKAISGRGAEWQDVVDTTTSTTRPLQAQVNALEARVKSLREIVEALG
jgi:membrane protein implicated in regulation of membrane protease activity